MRRAAIPIVVVLVAAVIFGATVQEALAFTWGDFADLCRNASAEELEAVLKRENVSISAVQDDKTSLLMVAAKVTPNPDVIQALVRLGSDPNAKNKDGWTALMFAARDNSNPEVIAALVKAGADPNAKAEKGATVLMCAAKDNSNPEVIAALVKAGADLVKAGADPNAKTEKGATVLMCAARDNSNPEVIVALVKAGADPNARNGDGMTALMFAAGKNSNPEVITTLVKADADPNARNENGDTALMLAAGINSNPEVITALVKAGADPNARDKDGWTALMRAARDNSNPEVIAALVKAGADPEEQNSEGCRAIDYAVKNSDLRGTAAFALLKSKSSLRSGEQDGAFGPDLTGAGWLRIGTRCKNFAEIREMVDVLNNFQQHSNSWSLSVHPVIDAAENSFPPLVELKYDGGNLSGVSYSFPQKGPTSLKEGIQAEEQAKNMSEEDWLKKCEPYAPFVICVRTNVYGNRSSLFFLRGVKDKSYRLMECELGRDFWQGFWKMDASQCGDSRTLATTLLKKFGEENGIDDMYVTNNGWIYFWKDPSKGYALCISGGRCCIFPIVDEHTLYPLKYFNGNWRRGEYLFVSKTKLRKAWGTEVTYFGFSDFEPFFKHQVLSYAADMGFTGFGDSLELDH